MIQGGNRCKARRRACKLIGQKCRMTYCAELSFATILPHGAYVGIIRFWYSHLFSPTLRMGSCAVPSSVRIFSRKFMEGREMLSAINVLLKRRRRHR